MTMCVNPLIWYVKLAAHVSRLYVSLSFPAQPRAVITLSPEMPFDCWMRGWTLSLSLPGACFSSSCRSSRRSRCVYLLCRPPPSCSLITAVRQRCLGGSHSIVLAPPPHHLSVLLWVLAPQCPPHPVERTGTKSLWYLAPRCPGQVTLTASCLFSPRTELPQTAAILLLLVLPVCPPLLHSNQII